MHSNEWLIIAMSILIRTMIMATWYSANRNVPTPSTTDVAVLPVGKLTAYSLPCSFDGYLISMLPTGTRPNIDQKRLNKVRGNLCQPQQLFTVDNVLTVIIYLSFCVFSVWPM